MSKPANAAGASSSGRVSASLILLVPYYLLLTGPIGPRWTKLCCGDGTLWSPAGVRDAVIWIGLPLLTLIVDSRRRT